MPDVIDANEFHLSDLSLFVPSWRILYQFAGKRKHPRREGAGVSGVSPLMNDS